MADEPLVVIGLVGPTLDGAKMETRWNQWRPTVSICQHEELLVHRFELLYSPSYVSLAELIRDDIGLVSPETEVRLHAVEMADPWDFQEVYGALHDFARDYPFTRKERYAIHITTGTHVAQICLFLLNEARYLPGQLLQTAPPKRRNQDHIGSYTLIDLDLSKYDKLAERFQQEQQESLTFLKSGIATRNATFNRLIEEIEYVAVRSTEPVLLMGPTGAGKSQLAKRIYELKEQRRQVIGRFVEVNCATLRGDTAMSTLFGHKKGAFTGALQDREGLLKSANDGVLFLDEIGELGPDEQAMLLRALEEGVFMPMGSDREVSSRFQLLAGTNRDLQSAISKGRFREDLLARINLWTFQLPALRDRTEDIEPNLDYEMERASRGIGKRMRLNKEARAAYLRFAQSPEALWSANFRDLNASVARMATLAQGGRIRVEDVEREITRLKQQWKHLTATSTAAALPHLEIYLSPQQLGALDSFDAVQLNHVLEVCQRSRSLAEAGRQLFAASRQHKTNPNDADRVRKFLLRFGINWRQIQNRPD